MNRTWFIGFSDEMVLRSEVVYQESIFSKNAGSM